jgi:hypothetical protein
MLSKYIIAVAIILAAFAGWVMVQHLARLFAARHPEFGAAREEGGGCGIACRCSRRERDACLQAGGRAEQKVAKDAKQRAT